MLRPYQVKDKDNIISAWQDKKVIMYRLDTGGGKCLGKDTPVLMFDGTIKKVQDIKKGDLLIGPDSEPRNVLSISTGREMMYRVTPVKGDPFICNESHILSLKITGTARRFNTSIGNVGGGDIVNVSVKEYLSLGYNFRHCAKGWRSGVDFNDSFFDRPVHSYFLGLWLGDGHSDGTTITTGDKECIDFINEYACALNAEVRVSDNSKNSKTYSIKTPRGKTNPLLSDLRNIGVINNKHIPLSYKKANRNERLQLLAGLIDSDGSYTGKGYDICLKSERLMDDLLLVARSLGFAAYKNPVRKTCHNNGITGDYFRCNISGHVDEIPCKVKRKKAKPRKQIKNVLLTGIKVEPIGKGDYYGFEIDGDHLFLLGDFTVTHNTQIVTSIIKDILANKKRVVFVAHREELIKQAFDTFYRNQIFSGIIKAGVAPNYSLPCQIGSIQTMIRRDNLPPADYFIIDESHHALEDNTYGKVIRECYPDAQVLGVTATPYRLGGKGFTKMFEDLIDSSVNRVDLINMGFLSEMVYYAAYNPDMSKVKIVKGEYDQDESVKAMEMAPLVQSYKEHADGKAGIVFAINVDHSKKIVDQYRQAGIEAEHIDADTPTEDRRRILKAFKEKRIKILSNVGIATEGFDMPNMDFCQLARPSLSLSLICQMVGRAGRIDNDVIKNCTTDESRKAAIAVSHKPFGIILDNAGLHLKHPSLIAEIVNGSPINWRRYFDGIEKKKKKKIDELIELEYLAEDDDGRQIRTKYPAEIEGMKLIKITEIHSERIQAATALNEFERLYEMFKRMPDRIEKPGWVALLKFETYCNSNDVIMTPVVWNHLEERLVNDLKAKESEITVRADRMIKAINHYYAHDPKEKEFLLSEVGGRTVKEVNAIAKLSVSQSFLKKRRSDYIAKHNLL